LVYLSRSDLRRASLFKANLWGGDLRAASLENANLSWADLRGANLDGVYLSSTIGNVVPCSIVEISVTTVAR
jgi:uncharacterized protein YjbI with pentapeptide repeats